MTTYRTPDNQGIPEHPRGDEPHPPRYGVGTELDALVDQHLFGHQVGWHGSRENVRRYCGGDWERIPPYSASISDAWRVVERMRELGFTYSLAENLDQYVANFWKLTCAPQHGMGCADGAPEAVCRAALHALGIRP